MSAAFDDLGDPADMDDALIKPRALFFSISFSRTICHVTSS
jgi:hypothetical protein